MDPRDIAEVGSFLFTLLVVYQVKHYLADYPLQGKYMLGKFKESGWELPLFCHALVHGVFTFVICIFLVDFYWAMVLATLDLTTHFIVDRIKASPHLFGRYKTDQKMFWLALGLDQFLHHITHYIIIFAIFYQVFLAA